MIIFLVFICVYFVPVRLVEATGRKLPLLCFWAHGPRRSFSLLFRYLSPWKIFMCPVYGKFFFMMYVTTTRSSIIGSKSIFRQIVASKLRLFFSVRIKILS